MLVFFVSMGEIVAPMAEEYGQRLRTIALDKRVNFMGRDGIWVRDESRYIYVQRIIENDILADIDAFEFDDDRPEWAKVTAVWGREEPPSMPIGTRFYLLDHPFAKLWLEDPHNPLFISSVVYDERKLYIGIACCYKSDQSLLTLLL